MYVCKKSMKYVAFLGGPNKLTKLKIKIQIFHRKNK